MAKFLADNHLTDVKISINQWAPHKEIARVFKNKNIVWPYKIFFLPSTLVVSLIARPFSGLLISDYYDPASNTVHLFSDEICIGMHEAGHAKDFASRRWKGTYALLRMFPGLDVFQESVASDEAFYQLEAGDEYEELFRAYRILYPAYSTYISGYLPVSIFSSVGALGLGHIIGRAKIHEKKEQLKDEGKLPSVKIID